MALTPIQDTALNEAKIASILGDVMTGTADENKAKFDELPMLVANKLNDIIAQLTGNNTSGTTTSIDVDGDINVEGTLTAGEIDAATIHFDDSSVVKDANYVHTDNNFTTALKTQITTNQSNINTLNTETLAAATITALQNIGYTG